MKRHFIYALMGLVFSLSLLSSVVLAVPDTWTKKADIPTARFWLCTNAVNGKIYAIGGVSDNAALSTVEVYDPVSNIWTKKKNFDLPTVPSGLSTCVMNGKIYAFGVNNWIGVNGILVSTVKEYDPVSDKWTKLRGDMPTARYNLCVSVVNGKIYTIGGFGWNGNDHVSVSTVEEYDPMSGKWTKKTDMPTARALLSASTVNGKIYAIGGGGSNGIRSEVEEYNPETDTWTRKANMPAARYCLSTSVVNGKIYAIGGAIWNGVNEISVSTVEEYDPASDIWTKKANMATARWSLCTSEVNGKIYAIGGSGDFTGVNALSVVEEYDTGFSGEGVEAKDKLATKWGKLKGDER